MRNMGNTKANSIYNPDESRHPPPTNTSEFNDRDSELEKFIRRKYVEGRFKPSAAGHVEEVSRPRASSIRANGTGTSSTGSFQRQSPNPELNDIVVPRTRATVGGSTEEPRPPIFATRSSGNCMGVTDSPGRSRPRPTHSATLEIPVLSHEESSAYSLDHPSGSGGRPGSSSGSRPRSFLSTAGRGATKNMVQDNWNDLMMASSADETQTGPGGRRSPNPFARAQSANAGRSTTARPESGRQAVAPALEARYGEQKAQGASGGAFGDLLGIGAGSTLGSNGSGHAGQPTSTPSYGGQYPQQQQQQPTMQSSYATPTSQPFTSGMVNGSTSTQFSSNGMNGNMGMGMGMNGGMSMQTPNGMQINPNMNMGMNQGMSLGTGSTSPFPLAATSPYSSFSNGNGGYFPQQPQMQQQQLQPQYAPSQQLYQQPQSQFQQQGYPQMQMQTQMQGYGQAQGQSMPMQGNQMGMMVPPGWGGAGASR
jgi:stromal membrane-associated protein